MPDYVISLKYCDAKGCELIDYESQNPNLKRAKQDAKALAKEERKKTLLSVRVVRVESRAASDRRRKREFGI